VVLLMTFKAILRRSSANAAAGMIGF